MSFDTAVVLMRSWGREVVVLSDAEGRNNGIGWAFGGPIGQINHHFVASMDPGQTESQVEMVRDGYSGLPGPVVSTYLGVDLIIRLIATGPCNHAGQGASSVVDRIRNGQPPAGPAAMVGAQDDGVKNAYYSGTECQHPGDATPWPDDMIAVLVDWNAALCIAFGWGDDAHACIQHYESTARKPDMSWRGGVDGDGGPELRRRVAERIALYRNGTEPTEPPDPPEEDMPLSDEDISRIVEAVWTREYKQPNSSIGRQSMESWVGGTRQYLQEIPARVAGIVGAIFDKDLSKVKDWIAQGNNAVKTFLNNS